MDIEALWKKAVSQTEIHRMRLQDLATFEDTLVPYTFLSESSLNKGDTVVRQGKVLIQKPALLLPGNSPQFEGFDFELDNGLSERSVSTFLYMRGIQFPSMRYRHEIASIDLIEKSLQESIDHYKDLMARHEDIQTGLLIGPEDTWQFSLLILVGALVARSSGSDIQKILDKWKQDNSGGLF